MGHANYSNISRFFARRLYAKGRLSIGACVEAMAKAKEYVGASEGRYYEPEMLSMALTEIVAMLRGQLQGVLPPQREKVIEPVEPLTADQRWALGHFTENTESDLMIDESERFYAAFDSIEWKYAPGWRAKYPDEIPHLGNVTH